MKKWVNIEITLSKIPDWSFGDVDRFQESQSNQRSLIASVYTPAVNKKKYWEAYIYQGIYVDIYTASIT